MIFLVWWQILKSVKEWERNWNVSNKTIHLQNVTKFNDTNFHACKHWLSYYNELKKVCECNEWQYIDEANFSPPLIPRKQVAQPPTIGIRVGMKIEWDERKMNFFTIVKNLSWKKLIVFFKHQKRPRKN